MSNSIYIHRLETWVPAGDRFASRWKTGKNKGNNFGCEDMCDRIQQWWNGRPQRLMLDCGSFVGWVARYWSPKFQHIHCWEPNDISRESWMKNCGDLHNVTLHTHALGRASSQGFLNFHTPNHYGNCTVSPSGQAIKIRSIDSYNFDHVDLLKIDVEGYELAVLEGARNTLERCRPHVQIEINNMQTVHGHSEHDVHEWLQNTGMKLMFKDAHWDYLYAF